MRYGAIAIAQFRELIAHCAEPQNCMFQSH